MELDNHSTLSDLFIRRVAETPNGAAFRQLVDEQWRDWSWSEISLAAGYWQAAFLASGLKKGDRVAICARNSVEWVLFDQAAIALGLVVVPLYFDDRPENMLWCLNDSGARLLFLEDMEKWRAIGARADAVERVIVMRGSRSLVDAKVVRLDDWLPKEAIPISLADSKPDELATIVYTSGTTGKPRGVMLSHRNLVSNVCASLIGLPADPHDRFLSFLPLSHVFERTCGYYSAMFAGAQTVYARSISLLGEDLREQRPTIVMAVPRIFERVYHAIREAVPPGSRKRRLLDKTVEIGWRRFNGEHTLLDRCYWAVVGRSVAARIRDRFGGRLRAICAGGAPLSNEHAKFFVGLGIPLLTGYGLTECAPVVCTNPLSDSDPFSVGPPLPGVEIRLSAQNEIVVRGPNVMLGYWKNAAATAAVLNEDGWFHTGDIGILENGRYRITGRLKDIIVLSNGEKIAPADVERAILRDGVFEQVMVIGEAKSRLGLLCVARITDQQELCARANDQLTVFPGYVRVHHVHRTETPWTLENGLLTPTLKLKRAELTSRYADDIERMYQLDLFNRAASTVLRTPSARVST